MNMKRIYYFLPVLLLCTNISCKKFLDVEPKDFLPPSYYYQTEEQLLYSLAGVYDPLGSLDLYGRHYISRVGIEADEGFYNTSAVVSGPQVYNFTSSDTYVSGFWRELYMGINRANTLLANVDNNPNVNEAVRLQIRGEALFLRGYYYFLLAQNFGAVPLLLQPATSPDDTDIARSPLKEVYEQVLADMKGADALVAPIKTFGFGGRVSKSAVRGILARVCLYMAGYPLKDSSKYQEASIWAKKVIDDREAGHMLNPDYTQIFINYAQDKYDIKESIFEVEFWGNGADGFSETGSVGAWIGIYSSNNDIIGNAFGFLNATAKLYRSFEASDVRRDCVVATYIYSATGTKTYYTSTTEASLYTRRVGKYRREWELIFPKSNNATPTNFPLLRFADVLLMYAEAENEFHNGPTPDAVEALNLVRARAHASLYTGSNSLTNKTDFFNALVDERSRELCFEALRKPDLIRWGLFIPTMKGTETKMAKDIPGSFYALAYKNVAEKHLLYPIPSRELSLNPTLNQNPNW